MKTSETTFFVSFNGADDNNISSISTFYDPKDHDLVHTDAFSEKNRDSGGNKADFSEVISSFISVLNLYIRFIPVSISLMPQIFEAVMKTGIIPFVKKNGALREDLSVSGRQIYELDLKHETKLDRMKNDLLISNEGARLLPEIMVIGLISAYDFYLSEIIRDVLRLHPEIILTPDKSIKLSDLKTYGSIKDAEDAIINKEIENVIRSSHHEQFDWMQSKFSIPLRDNLAVWPVFVEICERRNLLTHTGGIISHQYLKNCHDNKVKIGDVSVGDKLDVTPKYFVDSVRVIYEIGVKLGHVLWRKFLPADRQQADEALVNTTYQLTMQKEYALAESLLKFAIDTLKKYHSDALRRTFIINFASVRRLQGDVEGARRILDKEDWSSSNDRFNLCAEAVYGRNSEVLSLMKKIGTSGTISVEEYREWPIFTHLRNEDDFKRTFEEIFGEQLMMEKPEKVELKPEQVETQNQNSMGNAVLENDRSRSTDVE